LKKFEGTDRVGVARANVVDGGLSFGLVSSSNIDDGIFRVKDVRNLFPYTCVRSSYEEHLDVFVNTVRVGRGSRTFSVRSGISSPMNFGLGGKNCENMLMLPCLLLPEKRNSVE
jgi:hypothetical protein